MFFVDVSADLYDCCELDVCDLGFDPPDEVMRFCGISFGRRDVDEIAIAKSERNRRIAASNKRIDHRISLWRNWIRFIFGIKFKTPCAPDPKVPVTIRRKSPPEPRLREEVTSKEGRRTSLTFPS